ncbi:hypothetical protein PGB90_001981 [Kerria lacca]
MESNREFGYRMAQTFHPDQHEHVERSECRRGVTESDRVKSVSCARIRWFGPTGDFNGRVRKSQMAYPRGGGSILCRADRQSQNTVDGHIKCDFVRNV